MVGQAARKDINKRLAEAEEHLKKAYDSAVKGTKEAGSHLYHGAEGAKAEL